MTKSNQKVPIPQQVLAVLDKAWLYNNLEFTQAVLTETKAQHPDAHIYFDEEWVTRALVAEERIALQAQELSKAKDDLKYFSGLHEKAHRETSEERDRLKAELSQLREETQIKYECILRLQDIIEKQKAELIAAKQDRNAYDHAHKVEVANVLRLSAELIAAKQEIERLKRPVSDEERLLFGSSLSGQSMDFDGHKYLLVYRPESVDALIAARSQEEKP